MNKFTVNGWGQLPFHLIFKGNFHYAVRMRCILCSTLSRIFHMTSLYISDDMATMRTFLVRCLQWYPHNGYHTIFPHNHRTSTYLWSVCTTNYTITIFSLECITYPCKFLYLSYLNYNKLNSRYCVHTGPDFSIINV